jgi:cyclopropane fatty-acyl-phospholipid synthase-like methyltransferase
MRLCVADIVVQDMQSLRMHYPEVEAREREHFDAMRRQLREDRQ